VTVENEHYGRVSPGNVPESGEAIGKGLLELFSEYFLLQNGFLMSEKQQELTVALLEEVEEYEAE
jgi:DNA-directed RNA polymerase beta subunit